MEISLKYGLNPHQGSARLVVPGDPPPLQVLNGKPGYINMLDALGSWQLVWELKKATGLASAASFKHVSPAGAAVARPLTEGFLKSQMLEDQDYSPVAQAYIRARGGDRMSSFGDVAAVSDTVDVTPTTGDGGTGGTTETPPGIPGFPISAILLGLILSVTFVAMIRRQRILPNRGPATSLQHPWYSVFG